MVSSMKVISIIQLYGTNMGMVEDNLVQLGNNLEEAWANLVEEYFRGLQYPCHVEVAL